MNTDITVNKINETLLEIKAPQDILHDLYNRYSAYAPGYQFSPKFKNRIWDGKVHLFNARTGMLPIGFMSDLIAYALQNFIQINYEGFTDEDNKHKIDETVYENNINYFMRNSGKTVRDYQDKAIRAALEHRKGILLSCTGSGKSLMIYNIIRSLRKENFKKILLIVPNIILIDQMKDDFIDYGYDDFDDEVTLLGGGYKPDLDKPVLISTWESLQNKDRDFFENFEAVFVDEVHGSKAKKLLNIVSFCDNARVKIGTTGTLPTDASDLLKVHSLFGPVLFELKSMELIDRGVLTKLQIANILAKYPSQFIMENKGREYQEEVRMVETYKGRYNVLKEIISHTNSDHNILVLVNHISHLNETKEWLEENYQDRKVKVISGGVKKKDRSEIRTGIENDDGVFLLGTYQTMSTGVNIPKLHDVILFADSKSKIKVLQTIGRGLRKHHTKNKVMLFDIVDDLSYQTRTGRTIENYLVKHWRERLKYYDDQQFPYITTSINI